jgi:AraC-like DNA-binding protein
MRYTEAAPRPPLASIVRCIWTLEGHAAELESALQPVLPDGRPELVMHFGDAFERVHPDGWAERQAPILFAGQITGQLALRPTGRIAVLGVSFHPDGAAAVLNIPQHTLVGLTIGVDALAPRLCQSLIEVRESAVSLADAACAVQERLAEHVDPARIDLRIRHAVEAIRRRRGALSMDDLAADVGLTRRHLERRFQTLVGISPKRLARIARFQHAIRVLERLDVAQKSTHTAATCGYADQAHFVHDFRELAGCPPGAHLLRRAEISGFFTHRPADPPPSHFYKRDGGDSH